MPKKKEKPAEESDSIPFIILDSPEKPTPKLRILGLYGTVDEEKCAEAVYSLIALKELGRKEVLEDPLDPESEIAAIEYRPIEFYISTWGGDAAEMFSVYDTMRMVKEDCEIHTTGLGKVMSAGVLLLAAGTKGKRKIGKNCRVMMHSIIGGQYGPIYNVENEMEEMRWIQQQHISALVEETDMTKRYLKKILDRKVNVYLNAKEAVELGIADEII